MERLAEWREKRCVYACFMPKGDLCVFVGEREGTSGERYDGPSGGGGDGPGRSGGMDSEKRKDVS